MNEILFQLVDYIPDKLENNIVYISLKFKTVNHNCACGCGSEIVTPLSPNQWRCIFDGETVSLYPSIGSWDLPCKSHYWIKNNKIEWAESWEEWNANKEKQITPLWKFLWYR